MVNSTLSFSTSLTRSLLSWQAAGHPLAAGMHLCLGGSRQLRCFLSL